MLFSDRSPFLRPLYGIPSHKAQWPHIYTTCLYTCLELADTTSLDLLAVARHARTVNFSLKDLTQWPELHLCPCAVKQNARRPSLWLTTTEQRQWLDLSAAEEN